MKRLITSILFTIALYNSFAQSLVKIGDIAPNYHFIKVLNAPKNKLDLSDLKGVPTIIAFWGTWCAPCIPEMINLGKLKKQYGEKLQILAVSDDNEQKLKYFLQKRPSKIWFASDASDNLWNILGINTAGHAALIDKNNKIVTITETNKVDSMVIKKLLQAKETGLQENRGDKLLSEQDNIIKSDTSTLYSFVIQSEIKGISAMMKRPNSGQFANRRITIINLKPIVILNEAFGISTSRKVIFSTKEDSIKSRQSRFCIDFIVPEEDKANVTSLFQKELNTHLPVQGRMERRFIACYILQPIEGKQVLIKQSSASTNKFSFNGLAFSGEGIPISTFIKYLENELNYPVYDSTGLVYNYNVEFSKNNVEPLQSVKDNLAKLGLELVKGQKEMGVLVISGR